MLQRPIRDTQDFLLSNYFAEGLRITFGVLCPSLIMAHFGMLQFGMTLSLGALCVSIVDSPGPIHHRRNAMFVTTALLFLVSIIVGLTNKSDIFIGILLVAFSFIFSMLFLYGARAASIGTSVLLVMILSIDDVRPWKEVIFYSMLVLLGGIWYTSLSYIIYRLRPYRLAQQTLSDSIHEIADFLRAKAKFYSQYTNYEKNYADLLQLQVDVHQKQDEVREVLFKTREIVRESTPQGRFLLIVFTDTVDLFEQVMSTYYNYKQLHEQFDSVGILSHYEEAINKIADSLDDIAFSLKSGGTPTLAGNLENDLAKLRQEISDLEQNKSEKYNTLGIIALRNIEVNIENIVGRIKTINKYFNKNEQSKIKKGDVDVGKFVTSQEINVKLLINNLTFSSSTFRHSVRVAIVMFIGFVVAKSLDFAHSYWILLTILVISKPGFSLTKERNYHRIIGTVAGAFIGMGVLHYVHDKNTLFVILILFMIAGYSFQRKNYVVSVLFMTPYILIMFDFLGMGTMSIAKERIYDTLIGSGIALMASYSLFPNWEHEKVKEAMTDMIKSNQWYFTEVTKLYFEKGFDLTNYKLARKEVYVKTSNLASMFQRMFSEPKSKQVHIKELHQFTVLNHLLSSYIASLSLYIKEHHFVCVNYQDIKPIADNTIYLLENAEENLRKDTTVASNVPLIRRKNAAGIPLSDTDIVIEEQFDLIQKVSYDIFKLTEKIKI
ncbi:FUSC family protein [Pedobacter xixiisoli]|uniref:TIGR01666 family membrane protein n=1 Tax=Pedobacter xixiisoli TaxID=1476464 RepID=A0A285ZU55_9SPHI|nr:FUSC family membrane protein [Pedobacter xixiisoli]SOD13170.1 TIGR01666 family membrane protein [Pedobacter xixiisoli]